MYEKEKTNLSVMKTSNIIAVKKPATTSYNEMFEQFSALYDKGVKGTYNREGGATRGKKGKLGVALAKQMLTYAAEISPEVDMDKFKIVEEHTFCLPFENVDYLDNRAVDPIVANDIIDNLDDYFLDVNVDLAVFYDGKFILGVEAKSYIEATMFKRFLFEVQTLKTGPFPSAKFAVFQLENGLGGDYADDKTKYTGSRVSQALMARFNTPIEIRTVLDGQRRSTQPIHNARWYKPVSKYKFFSNLKAFNELITAQITRNQITK